MGNIASRTLFGICILLAMACVAYGVAVWNTRSGTSFWLVWIVFAAILVLLGLSFLLHWWSLVPKFVRYIVIVLAIAGLACFGLVESQIIAAMNTTADSGLDYVIVLGAQVRKGGPALALRYRLDKAIEYLEANPGTKCVVSGGKGPNEPFPEAQGMAAYLEERGIDSSRIIQESKSTTTEENIRYSLKLIESNTSDSNQANASNQNSESNVQNLTVGVVTNNFHMFRALQIAHNNGLPQTQGIPAGSPPDMLVNNMVREFFAEVKYLL